MTDGSYVKKGMEIVVFVVIATSLIGTVYTAIAGINTTGWSTLAGGTGAITITQICLLLFAVFIALTIVKGVLE